MLHIASKSKKLNTLENVEMLKEKHKNQIINIQSNNPSDTIFSPVLHYLSPQSILSEVVEKRNAFQENTI